MPRGKAGRSGTRFHIPSALCAVLLLGAGAAPAQQAVTYQIFSTPMFVINVGRAEVLGAVRIVATNTPSGGSLAATIQFLYLGVGCDNDASNGVAITARQGFGTAAISSVSNGPSGCLVSVTVPAQAVAMNDFIEVGGVRGRIDLSTASTAGSSLSASLSATPSGSALFTAPTTVTVALSAVGRSVSILEGIQPTCLAPPPSPSPRVRITEGFNGAFVQYVTSANGTSVSQGNPGNARPPAGALNNTKVLISVANLPSGVTLTWPLGVDNSGSGVTGGGAGFAASTATTLGAFGAGTILSRLERITSATATTQVYEYVTADQGLSDVNTERFDIIPAVSLSNPALGTATAQVQLSPGLIVNDASSVTSAPFGVATGAPKPRFNDPLTAAAPLLTVGSCTASVSSISPNGAIAGGAGFTLTVNGSGFLSTAVVRWNGSDRATTFVSSAQLQATILVGDIALAGLAQVTVFNPPPGDGTSNAAVFLITNPGPFITSLSPTSASPGGPAFTLTVNGTFPGFNFVPTSVVRWNGADRITSFVNSTQLQAAIAAGDIAAPGTAVVTVFTPGPGGGTSNVLFNITAVLPTASISITNVNPSSLTLSQGGSAQSLTVSLSRTDYTGAVTLGLSPLPSGVTSTISNPDTGNSGSITLQASSSATLVSNQTITVTASGAGVASSTATFTLTVDGTPAQVTYAISSLPTFVINTGRAEVLGAVRLTALNTGPTAASTIQFLYKDIGCDNDTTNGVVLNVSAPFTGGNAQIASVTNTSGGCVISVTVAAGLATTANSSFLEVTGVRARVDLSPAASAGSGVSVVVSATPSSSSLFSGGSVVAVATSAVGRIISIRQAGTLFSCLGPSPLNPTPRVRITEGFNGAFVQHVTSSNGTSVSPSAPGNARFAAGATNNTQIIISVTNLPAGVTLTWPVGADAVTTSGIFTPIAASTIGFAPTQTDFETYSAFLGAYGTTGGRLARLERRTGPTDLIQVYEYVTVDQGQSDITLERFNIVPAVTLPNTLVLGTATVQVQLSPPLLLNDATSVTSAVFSVGTAAPKPRFNDPGFAPAPALLTISRCTVLYSLSPNAATAGGGFTLTVNGVGFFSTSVVRWNGSDRATTFVSSAQLQAAIPASDIAEAGSDQVTVFSALGGTSNSLAFTVSNPLALNVGPLELNFGPQAVSTTSAGQTVTISNGSSASFDLSLAISGDFAKSTTCGGSLVGGASCTVTVTFTPTMTGLRTGLLSISDGSASSPHVVRLFGAGTSGPLGPRASLSNLALNFGVQAVSTTSVTRTVTLTNSGDSTLTVTSVSATGDFAILVHTCGSVAAGGACGIYVTFTPTTTGTRTGSVRIVDNAAGSPQVIRLFGAGDPGAVPAISFSSVEVNFGNQVNGTTSAARTVTVTNTGTATLNITSVAVSGDFAALGCLTSLAPGSTCTVTITFTPTSLGNRRGSVTLTDNASGSPHVIRLVGSGT